MTPPVPFKGEIYVGQVDWLIALFVSIASVVQVKDTFRFGF